MKDTRRFRLRVPTPDRFLERLGGLSQRERDVALLIATGVMPAQIAEELGISVKTVSTYRARALEKLELDTNVSIAVAACRAGLLE